MASNQYAVPVTNPDGSLVAAATSATFGAAFPTTGDPVGGTDGVNFRPLTLNQNHNMDNASPPAGGYGALTSAVGQIFNPAKTLDRTRGIGADGIPAVGIAAGGQNLAGPNLTTTIGGGGITGSATSQTVTVASTASMKVGEIVITQDNAEYVEITAIPSGTTCTGTFLNNHASGQTLTWNHYNQARDATVGDNITGTGISPSATYLYNNVSATFEFDRSANGEKDGATGQGTAVAAEYEYNGNPLANGNVLSNLQFDRARNVQAGGLGAGTISNNPLAANSTTLTLTSPPTTLQAGAQIILDFAGANPETNVVGTGYTAGSTTVPLQIATQFSHAQNATVNWAQHSPLGPQLNGFLPSGLGMEEEIIYDPTSKKYFVEIAATGDANSGQNLVIESPGLFNGTTFDRMRSAVGTTGIAAVNTEGTKATYSASSTGFTPVATPTDFFNIFGSGTKTVRITRIEISGTTSAATQAALDLQLNKRSTAGTLGSAVLTNLTSVPHDSNNAAGTAVPSTVGTANYTTLGTLVGVVQARKFLMSLSPQTATDFPLNTPIVFDFTNRNEQGIVLRGAAQQIALGFNGGTLPAGTSLDISITWTEE